VHSLELEDVFEPQENALSMGNSPYINNSLFISSFFSHFLEKKYFHGNVGTYKIGGDPSKYS
jgi:hypothetical protein